MVRFRQNMTASAETPARATKPTAAPMAAAVTEATSTACCAPPVDTDVGPDAVEFMGLRVGTGLRVGAPVGLRVVGEAVGRLGVREGVADGRDVLGARDGDLEGLEMVGAVLGERLGALEGLALGL